MTTFKQHSKLVAVTLIAVILAAVFIGAYTIRARAGAGPTLDPNALSALQDPSTAVATIPVPQKVLPPGFTPSPGQVHSIGDGAAYAWTSDGAATCFATDHFSSCYNLSQDPISYTIGDDDIVRSGQPAKVYGLAVDAVKEVTVTLADGRTFTATPTASYYEVDLPATAAPSDVKLITAKFGSAGEWNAKINISGAAAAP
jgi:hypothetical protein